MSSLVYHSCYPTMTSATHEHTLNVALGEVLNSLRASWRAASEPIGQILVGGGRPDILIEEASGWPVVIEAERSNHADAEKDAQKRLGRVVAKTGREIETAIALVYPPYLLTLDGPTLREAIGRANDLEYTLYTRRVGMRPDRLPSRGWIKGGVRDLAMLVLLGVVVLFWLLKRYLETGQVKGRKVPRRRRRRRGRG